MSPIKLPSKKVFYRITKNRRRLRVVLFSLFALCIMAFSLAFFTLSLGKPYIGAALSMSDQGWIVGDVDGNGLASQAGIRAGDIPVEVNGQSAEVFLEKYRKSGVFIGGFLRDLTVIDSHGQSKSVTLKDSSLPWQSLTGQIAWVIISVLFWIIGFYVFSRRPRDQTAMLLCLSALFFGLALSGNMAASAGIPTATELHIAAYVIAPWFLFHFFLVLPEERNWLHKNPQVYLIYLPAVVIMVLFPLVGYVDGQPVQWFRTIRLVGSGAGLAAASAVAVFNYFRAVSLRSRQQMKIVFIGCLVALVPSLVLFFLPQAIWGRSVLPAQFSILLIVFIPLAMGYAVLTQRLMDIDIVIRRSVVYGLITIIMAAILSAAIFVVLAFRQSLGAPEEILIALALAGVTSALFGPTKKRVELLIDRLLYKDRYDYRIIIQTLSISLNSVKELTNISRLIVGTTVPTLNLAGGCLFLKTQSNTFQVSAAQGTFTDPGKQNQFAALISEWRPDSEFPNSASSLCPELAFLIPLHTGETEVGILCLSQKTSRQYFSPDDIYLLQGLASVAAMAIHSAMLIRDVSMRDTFVSVASHELRSPLTSILGYSELLLRREAPEDTRKQWLKKIFDNSQRMIGIVDDLLNVSRIHSGKASIKLEAVALPDVLKEALSLAREGTTKHEFVLDVEPELHDALVDRDKFGQVIGNLLSNAVKYSPNGGRITLSAYNDLQRHRIVMSVADEGVGIGPEDRDSLFTTFHRIRRPETQGIRGSGLGLYIAKEWTLAMGGEIWFESELNKGSTFFVAIPRQDPGPSDSKSYHSVRESIARRQ